MRGRFKLIIVLHWRHFQWQKVLSMNSLRMEPFFGGRPCVFLKFDYSWFEHFVFGFLFLENVKYYHIFQFFDLSKCFDNHKFVPLGIQKCWMVDLCAGAGVRILIKINEIQRMASVWIHFNGRPFSAYCAASCVLVLVFLSKIACDLISVWRLSCISFLSLLWQGSAPNELWLYTLLSTFCILLLHM